MITLKSSKKFGIALICVLTSLNIFGQRDNSKFKEIYNLIEKHNFFKARELYDINRKSLQVDYQNFTEAILNNAFNRLKESEEKIRLVNSDMENIPDSLRLKLYEVKKDNAIKLFNYKEAQKTVDTILNAYREYLSPNEVTDLENDLKIWSAVQNIPAQKININKYTVLKMKKDLAGLNNLTVSSNQDTLNFIFDTGANLSTTSQSVAKRLKMKIIPVNIEVGTITGLKVLAQLAVGDSLKMGEISMHNIIFLVLPDEAMAFPQINYQIYGILGFPVIAALEEIEISQEGDFIVTNKEADLSNSFEMAMNELTPLIYIDGMHFTFDTGADKTIFYTSFYSENSDEIDEKYQPEKISFAGAGGQSEYEGFVINYTLKNFGNPVTLKNIQLLKEKIKEDETVYGNIGRDLIQQFNKMTINFERMLIKFE